MLKIFLSYQGVIVFRNNSEQNFSEGFSLQNRDLIRLQGEHRGEEVTCDGQATDLGAKFVRDTIVTGTDSQLKKIF